MTLINLKKFSSLLLLAFIFGCADKLNFPKIEKGIFSNQEVKTSTSRKIKIITGDTLRTISKKYLVSIRELINYNNLKYPYVLKPGKFISIPNFIKYKIKRGDSLYKIAECSKINVEDITQRNKYLDAKNLKVSSEIKLPYFAKIHLCKSTKRKSVKGDKREKIIKKIFKWPTNGAVVATFGKKGTGRRNDGINIKAPYGSPVRAAKSGKVIYKGNELPAWGNLVLVKHENGWTTAYAHLDKFFVKVGSLLKTGDIIGSVGKTGNVDSYQLHFQVRKHSKPLDPLKYLFK